MKIMDLHLLRLIRANDNREFPTRLTSGETMLNLRLNKVVWTLLLILMISSSIHAQEADTINKMIVWGKATVTQKADRFEFKMKIKSFGASLQQALESAQSKIGECVSKLKAVGYKADEFQTTHFIQGQSDEKAFLSSKKDYEINYELMIRSDQVSLLDTTLLVLNSLKIEAYDVTFSLKDEFELNKQVLKQAAANARAKAEILVKELNAQILETILIDEDADQNKTIVNLRGGRTSETGIALDGFLQQNLMKSMGSRTNYFVQEISKTVTVKVIYKIR